MHRGLAGTLTPKSPESRSQERNVHMTQTLSAGTRVPAALRAEV
jgi:hypothetical protein